jgi:hypothetical protein
MLAVAQIIVPPNEPARGLELHGGLPGVLLHAHATQIIARAYILSVRVGVLRQFWPKLQCENAMHHCIVAVESNTISVRLLAYHEAHKNVV